MAGKRLRPFFKSGVGSNQRPQEKINYFFFWGGDQQQIELKL
jgi:hypothetical protein